MTAANREKDTGLHAGLWVDAPFPPAALNGGWSGWNLNEDARFAAAFEPLKVRDEPATPDGRPVARLRMQADDRHSNPAGNVHGGAIVALIDIALFACAHRFGVEDVRRAATLDMSTQFVGAARLAEPLDVVMELVRETGRLVFLRGLLVQGEGDRDLVASFSATVRKGSPRR